MTDLPEDYTNANTPTGATSELPATGTRGLNTINDRINAHTADVAALKARTINTGTFLTGGGDLTANRTIALSATGTPSSSTFLRGDNVWAVPATTSAAVLDLTDDSTDDPNGPVAAAVDTGQTWTASYFSSAAVPTIASGRYTNPDTASGASGCFLTAQLTGPVLYMAGTFDFTSGGTTTGQAVALSCFSAALTPGVLATIPDSPCQIAFASDHYTYQVYSGGALAVIGTPHVYAGGPIGTVNQTAEVFIDRLANTATVKGPDGVPVTFGPDTRIGVPAAYACAQLYLNNAATDNKPRFQSFSAATTIPTTGGGGGTLGPDTVGWTELDATGTGGTNKFIAVDAAGNLSAAEPASAVPTYPLEVFHDWTTKANGAVGALWDSGQTALQEKSPSGVTLTISGGRFITPWTTAGPAAAYLTAQPSAPITKMTADFNFITSAAGTPTNTHQVGILGTVTNVPPDASSVPNGPCHLIFARTQFKYQTLSAGGFVDVGVPHIYATPFDPGVNQHVEVIIDKPNSRATVTGPDGVEVVFSHANIGAYAANFGTFEIYYGAANTDHRIGFQKMSISTAVPAGSGGVGPDTVGWTELIATGTPSSTTFVKVDAAGALSAATPPSGGGAGLGPDTVGWTELIAGGTPTASTFIKVDAGGNMSAAVPPTGGATVTSELANVLNYGANNAGGGDNVTAFRSAANITGSDSRPIGIPPGTYNFSTTPFVTGALAHMVIKGAGGRSTQINIPAGGYLVDSDVQPNSFDADGLYLCFGAGAFRFRYAGDNALGHRTITRCTFYQYTKAAISSEMNDNPYWYVHDNLFWGANTTTTMGIALSGWPNNSNFFNNSFLADRIHIKVGRGGPDQKLWNNDLLRFIGNQGFPKIDIWLVPGNTATDGFVNCGPGMVISDNKFGNEGLEAGDWHIVVADEGAGTYFGDRMPLLSTVSSNNMLGVVVERNDHKAGGAAGDIPLVYSTTPNIRGWSIAKNIQPDGPQSLLKLLSATGFVPGYNIVGPQITLAGINVTPALTTAVTGTLTGQCPKYLVG